MKSYFITIAYIASITLFISCKKNCNPESVSASFALNKQIAIQYDSTYDRNNYSIKDGNNILFQYYHIGAECENVFDDEWGEILTFAIDKDLSNFEYKDSELDLIKCHYQEYGAWENSIIHAVNIGKIKGYKISENVWHVSVAVIMKDSKKLEYTAKYFN